jgi:hypothetical protein
MVELTEKEVEGKIGFQCVILFTALHYVDDCGWREPLASFQWLGSVSSARITQVNLVGYLGLSSTMEVKQPMHILDLWKMWYTQAVQARAAALNQLIPPTLKLAIVEAVYHTNIKV